MRNKYQISSLQKIAVADNATELFFLMYDLVKLGVLSSSLNTSEGLKQQLLDDKYYIVHNSVFYKGKQALFSGEVYIAEKHEILSFLNKEIMDDSSRSFLVAPVFSNKPSYVVYVSDGSAHIYT